MLIFKFNQLDVLGQINQSRTGFNAMPYYFSIKKIKYGFFRIRKFYCKTGSWKRFKPFALMFSILLIMS